MVHGRVACGGIGLNVKGTNLGSSARRVLRRRASKRRRVADRCAVAGKNS